MKYVFGCFVKACNDPFTIGEPNCCQFVENCEIDPLLSGAKMCSACSGVQVWNGTHCILPEDCLCKDESGFYKVRKAWYIGINEKTYYIISELKHIW